MEGNQDKKRIDLDQLQKRDNHPSHWNNQPISENNSRSLSASGMDHNTNIQNCYLKPALLNLLPCVDSEELSHFPDNQLTPENMSLLLQAVRKYKMTHRAPTSHSRRAGKESLSSASVKKKVIDYGHKSKYGYNEGPFERKACHLPVVMDETVERFQTPQAASAPAASSSLDGSLKNTTEALIQQVGSQASTPNPQPMPAVPPVVLPVILPAVNQLLPPSAAALLQAVSVHSQYLHASRAEPPNHPGLTTGGQKNVQKESENRFETAFGVVKASWLPAFPFTDTQKRKKLPTPSEMHDYCAVTPRMFPHLCSLCNEDCKDKKDWIQHQDTVLHIVNSRWLRSQYPDWRPEAGSVPTRSEGDSEERYSSRQRSASPSPKRSRCSSPGHTNCRSWSRSSSSGRHRASRSRSQSPRRLPSAGHRSRSSWQLLASSRQSWRSSSKERRLGSSRRSPEGPCARAPCAEKRHNEQNRIHSSSECWEKRREHLEQMRDHRQRWKPSTDETGRQEQKCNKLVPEEQTCDDPECSTLASLTEKNVHQALALFWGQGPASGRVHQGNVSAQLADGATDNSDVPSDLVSVVQVIEAVLESKEMSSGQASTSEGGRNPQQVCSATKNAENPSAVSSSVQLKTSMSSNANIQCVIPWLHPGTAKRSKAENQCVVRPCAQQGSMPSDKAENDSVIGPGPDQGTPASSKEGKLLLMGHSPHTAASGKEENQHVGSQWPQQGIAPSGRVANESGRGPRPQQGATARSQSENQSVASTILNTGTLGKTKAENVHGDPRPSQSCAVSDKTEDKCLVALSIGLTCKAGSQEAERVPGNARSCSGTPGQASKPRVWICGDSLVVSAHKWVIQKRHFSQFDLLEQSIALEWHGQEDLTWTRLVPTLQDLVTQSHAPDVLILHLGENDLLHTPWPELSGIIKKEVTFLRQAFPILRLLWSEMLPATGRAIEDERVRREGNLAVGRFISSVGGAVIKHAEMSNRFPMLNIHGENLSHVGLDKFLEDIKKGILAYVLDSKGAAGCGLKGGTSLLPLTPSVAGAGLVPKSQEAAIQGDQSKRRQTSGIGLRETVNKQCPMYQGMSANCKHCNKEIQGLVTRMRQQHEKCCDEDDQRNTFEQAGSSGEFMDSGNYPPTRSPSSCSTVSKLSIQDNASLASASSDTHSHMSLSPKRKKKPFPPGTTIDK